MVTCLKKGFDYYDSFVTQYPDKEHNVALSLGLDAQSKLWVDTPSIKDPTFICLDVANGYMKEFHSFVRKVREKCPTSIIVAGNVVTPEGVEALSLAGADLVKIGIGAGSMCLTRRIAGVGYPQLSAVVECAETAAALDIGIVADGGVVHSGDIAKAFVAGAAFVMVGGMFSALKDSPGAAVIGADGLTYKEFWGSASVYQSGKKNRIEGTKKIVQMKHKTTLEEFEYLHECLQSAISYGGGTSIDDLKSVKYVLHTC
jgi:GMP reductase